MKKTLTSYPIGINYQALTESAKAEILRLVQLSSSLKGNGESPEIYRDWAYGAFLFWKALAGENALPGDVLHLEMLATGEASA